MQQSNASKQVLVALWMGSDFGREVMEGIHDYIRKSGASWRIRFADTKGYFLSAVLWMLRSKRLDGVISFYRDKSIANELRLARVPIVHEGDLRGYDDLPDFSGTNFVGRVSLDAEEVARAAVDHLFSRAGFRAAGFVENYFDGGWSHRRGDAIVAEFSRRGVPVSRFLHRGTVHVGPDNPGPDFAGLAVWLRDLPKPAAVVAANDAVADDVIRICEEEGIAVPRDVAVLGMDDNAVLCQHSEPNISSVHFDGRRAGYLAAQMLSSMMDGRPAPPRDSVRYGIAAVVGRASTATTPSLAEVVQKALDYVDAHACEGASLPEVVRHCGYSRSLVTRRFRQTTGMSVEEALRRRRLDEAKRLLRETNETGETIAARCGYESPCALRRAFRRDEGKTMSEYRAAANFNAKAQRRGETQR
ncbi:MAG: substrate-binding domain-containing protein [Kiritimatiellae bacterium]|nr:substrate-binding domain-containing protein [Kiritimatiellia bacterium]